LICNPLQFFYDLLFIYLIKFRVKDMKPGENCHLLTWQIIASLVVIATIIMSWSECNEIISLSNGRPNLLFSTFLFAWVIDQAKSLVTLGLVYVIVVRRFMYLAVNEYDFSHPDERPPPQENSIPRLKIFCLKFLESEASEFFSMFVIIIYTVFIMFWLLSPEFNSNRDVVPEVIMTEIDTYFLVFFFIEICLKLFASNMMYLYSNANQFDTVVVVISLIFNMMGNSFKFLGVLRLVRVVVILFRNITGNTEKLRQQKMMQNPVQSTVKII
jgi:hypothetical protein